MNTEPRFIKSSCPYCGNAGVNHTATFLTGCIGLLVDPMIAGTVRHAPPFFERLVDRIIAGFLYIFSLLGIASFSDDMEKALSHRSRVVWEEAKRRGIQMQQVILAGKPLEFYRAKIGNKKWFYFQSLPIPPELIGDSDKWEDKILLKQALRKADIPTPRFAEVSFFSRANPQKLQKLFSAVGDTLIVKPTVGSRGRHTTTNIKTPEDLEKAIGIGRIIAPALSVEEHLEGDVCRATVIDGVLAGFYRGSPAMILGDGKKNILGLIEEKNNLRHERVMPIVVSEEIKEHIARAGYSLSDVLPYGTELRLTYRTGRSHGGATKEMIDELHPSFVPILERAANTLKISVVGFDVIVPDPTKDAASQRWGIIESNTLPFIDLHYFALEGKPRNIAGMIWDLCN